MRHLALTWLGSLLLAIACGCASLGKQTKVDETIRGGQTVTTSEYDDEEKNYAGDLAPLALETPPWVCMNALIAGATWVRNRWPLNSP